MKAPKTPTKVRPTLKQWLNNLPRLTYKAVRLDIIDKCGLTVYQWNHIFSEQTVPLPEHQAVINKIAKQKLDYERDAKRVPRHKLKRLAAK